MIKKIYNKYFKKKEPIPEEKEVAMDDYYTRLYSYNRDALKYHDLALECVDLVKCDVARISKPGNSMFLIIGYKREECPEIEFVIDNYSHSDVSHGIFDERVVASGDTREKLIENTKKYVKFSKMDMAEYFLKDMPEETKERYKSLKSYIEIKEDRQS